MDERMLELTEALNERIKESDIQKIRQKAQMPKGVKGECTYCGNESLRLVNGVCAPCRDQRKLG